MDPLRNQAAVGKHGQPRGLECEGLTSITPAIPGEAGMIDGELAAPTSAVRAMMRAMPTENCSAI